MSEFGKSNLSKAKGRKKKKTEKIKSIECKTSKEDKTLETDMISSDHTILCFPKGKNVRCSRSADEKIQYVEDEDVQIRSSEHISAKLDSSTVTINIEPKDYSELEEEGKKRVLVAKKIIFRGKPKKSYIDIKTQEVSKF